MNNTQNISIKETGEALHGILVIAKELALVARDGLQLSDALDLVKELLGDEHKREALEEAFKGAGKIAGELRELSGIDIAKLVLDAGGDVIEIITELQKDPRPQNAAGS